MELSQPRKPWGYNLLMEIRGCELEVMQSKEKLQEYVIKLCKLIDMVRFGDCIIHGPFGEGNKSGLSLIQMIETSNITGHFADDEKISFIDIFSCKPYDINKVIAYTLECFSSTECVSHYVLRGFK